MSWSWLIILLATYPWLFAADLLSDWTAPWGFNVFVSGAAIVLPCSRLRRWQAVLFSGCVGFLFEARRPIPDGILALALVAVAIFLTSNKSLLRSAPRLMRASLIVNLAAATLWFSAVALTLGQLSFRNLGDFLPQLLLQLIASALVTLILFWPLSLSQIAALDHMNAPLANETP